MSSFARSGLALVGASLIAMSLAGVRSSLAQSETAPAQAAPAPAQPDFLARFGPAERSPEAIAKGEARGKAIAKAYRDAKAIRDTIEMSVGMPNQEPQPPQSMRIAIEGDSDIEIVSELATMRGHDGKASVILEDIANRYLEVPMNGSFEETLRGVIPYFQIPVPHLAFRSLPDAGAEQLGFKIFEKPVVIGYREEGDVAEILLTGGDGSTGLVTADAKTNLLERFDASFHPPGERPDFAIAIHIKLDPKVSETLDPKISFDTGSRTKVATWEELMPPPVPPVAVGVEAPKWTLRTSDGKSVSLAELKGNVVVIDFWATWCGPCRRGLPAINDFAIWAKESGKPIRVFGIATLESGSNDEKVRKSSEFFDSAGFVFPTLHDLDSEVFRSYGFGGIPATVVIDPSGRVAAVHNGIDSNNPGAIVDELKEAAEKALSASRG